MPIAWESLTKDGKASLMELDKILPNWKSVNEQMLALRLNNYSIPDTVAWKRGELLASGGETSMTVADTILIASLEVALEKKRKQLTSLENSNAGSHVIMEELERDLVGAKKERDESLAIVLRQQRRIFGLEDQVCVCSEIILMFEPFKLVYFHWRLLITVKL